MGSCTLALALLMGSQGQVRSAGRLLKEASFAWRAAAVCLCRLDGSSCGRGASLPIHPTRSNIQHTDLCPLQVIAFDRSHAKAAEVRRLAESFGLTCVKAYRMDATKSVLQPGQDGGSATSQQPDAAQAPAAAAQDVQQQDGSAAAAEAGSADGSTAAADDGGASRGRRGGPTQPVSEATLKRLERIAAARRARGLEAPPSAHTPEGKEAVIKGFPPESFDFVLCDAPCTALGLRPR